MRDQNRTLQLKLRDIEVANDDFERQARNTSSSLEDLESKYNVAIERAVMLEEEIKIGEQERERLRVDAQRLREELSDLKIEAEILQDKLKKQDSRHLSTISTDISILESPGFAHSPNSTASSPLITTPPDTKSQSTADTISELNDPPSPPMSDVSFSTCRTTITKTPGSIATRRSRFVSADVSNTPKPKSSYTPSVTGAGSRAAASRFASTGNPARTPVPRVMNRASRTVDSHKIPSSNSLTHIRTLTAQMQRLEARVHSARSKLPGGANTPPRISPRPQPGVPSTVTIRSRKRTVGSSASSSVAGDDTPSSHASDFRSSRTAANSRHVPRLSTSGVSRLSFGPLPNRNPGATNASNMGTEISRPASRASGSIPRPGSRADSHSVSGIMPPPRPMSRASLTGAQPPLGRPRSSMGMHGHGHSSSVSYSTAEVDEGTETDGSEFRTPSRRGTFSRYDVEGGSVATGIPTPSAIPMPGSRRMSGGSHTTTATTSSRRTSSGMAQGATGRKLADLGETY